MDELSKQTIMNELLQKIKALQLDENGLDKLDCEQRQKYLKAQNDFNEAKEKGVNRDDLKMFEDQMNFQKECTNLVIKAVIAFEDTKYPEAAGPVEELVSTDVEPKKKEETQKKPAESKLKFIKHITSQNVTECDSLTLDCTCQGPDDDLELIWLRNNKKKIHKNSEFRHERDGNKFKLTVTAVFHDDSGVYSALLKSKSTSNEQLSSCSVIIQPRDTDPIDPSFVQFPQSISLEKGEKAKFNCKISGSTPMTVQWNFNGKPLDHESDRFILMNDETEFSLEIPVVLATDEGQYGVIISNANGQITATYTLHVD